MGKNRKEGVHDGLVKRLLGELMTEDEYESYELFWEYHNRGYEGEVDLLAITRFLHDFYEVKCTRTNKSVRKAKSQYERFQNAFPKWTSNGFLYTPQNGIERL